VNASWAQHGFNAASDPRVAGVFDDIVSAFKGAAQSFPLMTPESQRYWAGRLAASIGEKLYDASVSAVALTHLGPQGPALVDTYQKVTEDAARGNLNAQEILANVPEIAKLAAASKQGPDAFRAAVVETKAVAKGSGDEGEQNMSAYVGQDGQSYPEVASRAVRSIHAQRRSPYYGYVRSGINQRIYLFPRLEDARSWFSQHVQLQPDHDYAAVFSASNLSAPIAGMEHYMNTSVSGDHVGNWLPFVLGLPLGGVGGYFFRRWQESTGRALPFLPASRFPAPPPAAPALPPAASGDPYVGGPWLDMVGQDYGYGGYSDGYSDGYGGYSDSVGGPWLDIAGPSVGGPWLDIVGAESDDAARRRSWPQTRALIQSAIDEVRGYASSYPTEAYVWVLHAPEAPTASRVPGAVVIMEGTTEVLPFSSQSLALDYLRQVAQTRPAALAMFERSSQHWPNPTAWRKSDDPEHAAVIAQHVASRSTTQASGAYVGASTVIGAAIDDVRRRAQQLAERRAGDVIGTIHTSKDGLWHTLAFRSADDADDWLNTATQDQDAYTYAAYFDKEGDSWPSPYIEKIGGFREPIRRSGVVGATIGAALDDHRTIAQAYATAERGSAAGMILMADGQWYGHGFNALDDAIGWLQQATQRDKSRFVYAAAFEKGSDGTAYVQDEEIGGARAPLQPGVPIPRDMATTGQWQAA